jgi:DNA-binding NarL/FixJ family response regulator
MSMIEILLVDSNEKVRKRLRQILELEVAFKIVGDCASSIECRQLVATLLPDVLIIDIVMPDQQGVQLIQALAATYPDLSIIVLTSQDNHQTQETAFLAGARAFISKYEDAAILVAVINHIAESKAL